MYFANNLYITGSKRLFFNKQKDTFYRRNCIFTEKKDLYRDSLYVVIKFPSFCVFFIEKYVSNLQSKIILFVISKFDEFDENNHEIHENVALFFLEKVGFYLGNGSLYLKNTFKCSVVGETSWIFAKNGHF